MTQVTFSGQCNVAHFTTGSSEEISLAVYLLVNAIMAYMEFNLTTYDANQSRLVSFCLLKDHKTNSRMLFCVIFIIVVL